ncbi:LysR family transcriptional regulator [Pseudomonas fuscovaginae UPB0736]|uniref:DNA-binding transcriptional regulator, LysR family n=1 Tax=Pseudomonas asplenii TaxID=53407 RepID=A0A1H6P4A0_9PSED|nr:MULTISPECIES: LysR family transcriptional regulator [Pseudomonas]UUQ64542.1 LysR family transcriptional regulator [Pseudomonas fuscovaginae UPB0736]UZE26973.1 LysR family transcriptional regulator [Pseudomonas asplenii]SEI21642.1 DNA-binding transcriptional regulator, LysR family [Pseudomonas fuscovaginae]
MFSSERLKGIDVFVAVTDLGSFTAAAKRLNLTSSAVSKSVARLENRLGTQLFSRTTRRLALTEAGAVFYKTCTSVLADLEEVEHALLAEGNEPHGKIRIDLPASYGRLHVLPLILEFLRAHPLLQPHISFSDRFVDPVHEGIDILVRIGGPDAWPAALGHQYFGSQRMMFCASPSYLQTHGAPETERDLDNHHCVGYGLADGMVSPWYFKGRLPGDVERRTVQARIAVGDGEGEVSAILAGHGIGQLPTWLIQKHLDAGTLVEVLPELALDSMPMNLVWQKSRESLPKVRALLDYLRPRLCTHGTNVIP